MSWDFWWKDEDVLEMHGNQMHFMRSTNDWRRDFSNFSQKNSKTAMKELAWKQELLDSAVFNKKLLNNDTKSWIDSWLLGVLYPRWKKLKDIENLLLLMSDFIPYMGKKTCKQESSMYLLRTILSIPIGNEVPSQHAWQEQKDVWGNYRCRQYGWGGKDCSRKQPSSKNSFC